MDLMTIMLIFIDHGKMKIPKMVDGKDNE